MKISPKFITALIFILAGVLFVHSLTSINADVGRHIKLGEIIWQLKEVPKTNLLSFTEPDYPFINHHWFSEVIFYGVYSLGSTWLAGLKLIIIFKAIVLLAAWWLLFQTVRDKNIFAVALSFLVSVFVFSARTEPRPEIFSYLIFAAYLLIIYKARRNLANLLWLLPILQILWVNSHIYFAIGPVIYFIFLVERGVWKKLTKREIIIGLLILFVNLINPNFYEGAIYPLRVLDNYGYSVAENSSLFFLAKYFGQWSPQDRIFLVSSFVLLGSFILTFWRSMASIKMRFFDLALIALAAALSFKMQRNIPLYALALWPVMAENFSGIVDRFSVAKFKKPLRLFTVLILGFGVYIVVNGRFYSYLDSAKIFGLEISRAAQDGTDFVKEHKIRGPVFNNFDIGSYLAWQLYPEQKVFIDGRPEAYPVEFFEKTYRPMQTNEGVWKEMSEKYQINYVFFAHTDMTEWAWEFLDRISKDKEWQMVFLNDAVVIFVRNTDANRKLTDGYKITEENVDDIVPDVLDKVDKKDANAYINFGNALYRFKWLDASAKVFEALIEEQPDNAYGYQGAGYAYVAMNKAATQKKAADNLQKAIELGFKTFNNYFTLGIINANLGNYFTAEENIVKALEINPDNINAKQTLEMVRNKYYLR